jgi:hypothetical protein
MKVLMGSRRSLKSCNALQRVLENFWNYALMCPASADAAGTEDLGWVF